MTRPRSATALAELLRQGHVTPSELVEHSLERIGALNADFGAFLTVDADGARRQAQELQRQPRGPLWGIPVAVKDLALTRGVRTTFGSLDRQAFVPELDSLSVERIRAAGGIIIGKTNTPEFGYKAVTDNSLGPPAANPWRRDRTAGGSSGGSAVAVALDMVPLAEGTDGAGSIRVPASFCGVVGFKPTFGRIPRFPIPDQYNTLSHTGPLGGCVEDVALFLDVLAGPDPRDPLCLTDQPGSALEAVRRADGLSHLKIGFSHDLGYAEVDPSVRDAFSVALEAISQAGGRLEERDPGHEDPEAILLRLWDVSYAARFGVRVDLHHPKMTDELRAITEKGFQPTAWTLGADALARSRLFTCYANYFQKYDLLLTPTMPIPAFELTRQRPGRIGKQLIKTLFGWTPFTYPYNLTGLPALTVPMGRDPEGLPLGLQIVGPRGGDLRVLQAGKLIEAIVEPLLGRPWMADMEK